MSDIPMLARTQSMGEGFYHSIPKVTLFGSHLKDHEKTNHHGIVKRCCHVRISRLEFISESRDKLPSTIRVAVGLNKIRRSLITAPIDLTSCLEEIAGPTGPTGPVSAMSIAVPNGPTGLPFDKLTAGGVPSGTGPSGIMELGASDRIPANQALPSMNGLAGSSSAPINIFSGPTAPPPGSAGGTGSYGGIPSPTGSYTNPSLSPRSVREIPPPFLVPKKVYCYPMDIRISFHYDHSLKEHDDCVKITLYRNLPSKRQREFVPFAFTQTNLSQILQQGDFIADLDMSTSLPQKSTTIDNLAMPTSINVTICSVPKEIENIGDAQEYQLNDINLSDDENLFFDSDSYDEDEDEDVAYDIPIKVAPNNNHNQHQNTSNNNNNTLQVTSSTVNSNSGSNSTTPPMTSLSHKLMEQYEESKKKSIDKKSKLQKLSSFIKPTSGSSSTHKHNSDSLADDDDDRDDNSVDSSSSESDHDYDIELNPQLSLSQQPTSQQPQITAQSTHQSSGKKQLFPPFIQQQRDSPPGSPYTMRSSSSDFVKQSQIDSYLAAISNPDSPMNLFLVNSLRKGGKKLEQYLENKSMSASIRAKFNIVPTRSSVDLNSIFKALLTRHQNRSENIRVVIAGSDSYVNSVLKSYVLLLSTKPRGWDPFQFYLLPIGKSNEIATTIANHDPSYHALFVQPQSEWKRFCESEGEPDANLKRDLETKILSYIDKTNTRCTHKFPIGEALLTFPSATSTAIPFLKGIQIPKPEDSESGSETDLKIDYWVPKKKGDDHLEIKVPFQYVKLTRLSQITATLTSGGAASSSSSSSAQAGSTVATSSSNSSSKSTSTSSGAEYNPPNSSNSFSLYVLYKDKRSKKNTALYLPKFGKQKKTDKVSFKKEEKSSVSLVITKLMCGPMLSSSSSSSSTVNSDNTIFQVNIDGVEIPGVKYLSVSPQWATHVKQFSIQTFIDSVISEKSNSPISD